jgi:uncharacterized protein (TIGR00251 family)
MRCSCGWAAPPVDGAANEALLAFFAAIFDRPKRDITLVSGHRSRDKRVAVAGLTSADVSIRLDALLNGMRDSTA